MYVNIRKMKNHPPSHIIQTILSFDIIFIFAISLIIVNFNLFVPSWLITTNNFVSFREEHQYIYVLCQQV